LLRNAGYKKLKAYKINPTQKQAKRLESEFVAIFSEKTGYDPLDKAINGILLKKTSFYWY